MLKRTAMCVASLWALACFPLYVCAQEATELQKEALERVEQLAAAKIQLVKTLKSVDDQATALAAVAQIRADWANVLKAMEKASAFLQEHGAVFEHNDELFMPTRAELSKAEEAFDAELKRLELHRGLPAELWNVILPALVREELLGALKPSRVDEPGNAEYVAQLKARLDLLEKHQPAHVLTLVVRQCGPETRPLVKKWIDDQVGAGATVDDQSSPEEPGTLHFLAGPVKDVKKMASTVNFGDVTRIAPERGFLEVEAEAQPASAPSEQQIFQERVAEARAEAIKMGVDPDDFDRLPGIRGPIGVEIEEIDESAPDYHAKLAEMLNDGGMSQQRDAMRALLRISPSSVQDKKVRADIARGFRDLTFDSPHPDDDAVKGLIHWGGKHSVPLLIRLMEKNGRLGVDDSIYDGLAQYPTSEGAEAVAARLGNFFDGDVAASCLKRMGPVAEEAVIEVAPADNLDINFFALAFLKDFGTKKSYPLLQKARKSPNRQIREAAVETLREIRLREQAKEKSEEKQTAA